jgi:protoheme ferro-lyase
VAFRYARPLTEHALQAIKADGVKRVVAFTQFVCAEKKRVKGNISF